MFSSMKVGTRLAIAFGLVVVLLGAVLMVGVNRLALINEGVRTITQENNVEMNLATGLRGSIFDSSLTIRNMMLYTDADKIAKETESMRTFMERFESQQVALAKMFDAIASTTPTEHELIAKIKADYLEVRPLYLRTAELGSQMKRQEAYKYYFIDADGGTKNTALRDT